MFKFVSRYAGHRLKSPAGLIEFRQNEFVTDNEEFAAYLRQHPDFGVIIFEEKTETIVCEVCGKTFSSRKALAGHRLSCRPSAAEVAN